MGLLPMGNMISLCKNIRIRPLTNYWTGAFEHQGTLEGGLGHSGFFGAVVSTIGSL